MAWLVPDEAGSRAEGTVFPLSYAQQRLWFVHEWDPAAATYLYPVSVRITGSLDIPALSRALSRVVDRHWILRSHIRDCGGVPVQVVGPNQFELGLEDYSALSPGAREQALKERISAQSASVFDLAASLMRATLIRLGPAEHALLLMFHHIIFDGWSAGVLADDLAAGYGIEVGHVAVAEAASNPCQYGQFAQQQRSQMGGARLSAASEYWLQRLKPIPPDLQVPAERPRPESLSGVTGRVWLELDSAQSARLRELARACRATPYMILLATFQALLSRYSGQTDFCVGGASSGRPTPETFDMIGMFANQIVFRSDCAAGLSFSGLVDRVRRSALDAYRHDALPFEKLVELAQPKRSPDRHPLFQFALIMQPEHDTTAALSLPGLVTEDIESPPEGSALDLTMNFIVDGDVFNAVIDYSVDLWSETWARRFGERFATLLEAFSADPARALESVRFPDIPAAARPQAVSAPAKPVWAQFGERALEDGDAHAVITGDTVVSRAVLWRRSAELRAALAESGVQSGDTVAVSLARCPDLLAIVLACWRMGAIFVPLDPLYPDRRLELILADCGATVVVSDRSQAQRLAGLAAAAGSVRVLWIEDCVSVASQLQDPEDNLSGWEHRPAYVIYTSGSTGRPKGVVVHHGALSHYVRSAGARYLGATGVSPWHAPLGFDATITAVWVPLAFGGAVTVVPGEDPADSVQSLAELLSTGTPVGLLKITPAHLELLDAQTARRARIRTLVIGGDALHANQVRPWMGKVEQVINEYGPTETTVGVVVAEVRGDGALGSRVPIGRPLLGVQVHILDRAGSQVPSGVVGEIYLGGPQVALGYLSQPALTAACFVADPAAPGARMYRTGDLGWFDEHGDMHYAGRADDQVKINGHRVELGEVESVLGQHPAVSHAAVAVHARQLVGYLVAAPETVPTKDAQQVVEEWRAVFDETFGGPANDVEFDARGWTSSFDGTDLPISDMISWRNTTMAMLAEVPRSRVLEIGCGTGLLAARLAEECDEYVGTDFSAEPLRNLSGLLERIAPGRTTLLHAEASDLEVVGGDFDLIVINSVIQYFPSADYLCRVLEGAFDRLRQGGWLFVGDIRHAGLARMFQAELLTSRLPRLGGAELAMLADRGVSEEVELMLDPRFFVALRQRLGGALGDIDIRPKPGRYVNELTTYRYDVLLHKGWSRQQEQLPEPTVDWAEVQSIDGVNRLLAMRPEQLVIRSVSNQRLAHVARLVPSHRGDAGAVHPDDLLDAARAHDYVIRLSWAMACQDGSFDVLLARAGAALPAPPEPGPGGAIAAYANVPQLARRDRDLKTSVRRHLEQSLPSHMLPARLVMLPELPLTPNGKIERSKLPAPAAATGEARRLAPRTPTERALTRIWAETLGIAEVSVHDSFFDLGGDSIIALQVVARAKAQGIPLRVREMFRHQTVADLARTVDLSPPLPLEVIGNGIPSGQVQLAPIQLWYFARHQDDWSQFNFTCAYRVQFGSDRDRLMRAVQHVVGQHAALRMRFALGPDGEWMAEYCDAAAALVDAIDLSAAPADARHRLFTDLVRASQESLELGTGQLFKALHVTLEEADQRLVLVSHHLVMDGVSARILAGDIEDAYAMLSRAAAVELPARSSSYQSWSAALREYAGSPVIQAEAGYWQAVLATAVQVLPVDHPDAVNDVAGQRTAGFELDASVTRALLGGPARRCQAGIEEILLCALARSLRRWAGADVVLIDLESHGREDVFAQIDVSRTVGWFTAMFPFVLTADGEPGLDDLARLSASYQQVPQRGLGYGLLHFLRGALPPSRAQLAFNYQGRFEIGADQDGLLSGLDLSPNTERAASWIRRHEIEIDASMFGEGLGVSLTYNAGRYDQSTIDRLLASFEDCLRSLATTGTAHEAGELMAVADREEAELNRGVVAMSVEQQLDSLTRRVDAMEVIEQIRRLKHRYLRACDDKDIDALRSCFAAAAADIDYGALGRFDNAADFAAAFAAIALVEDDDGRFAIRETHHGVHPEIVLTSEYGATGAWTLQYRSVNLITMQQYVESGEYDDAYVRENGEWKILRSHYRTVWSLSGPLSQEDEVS
jgi:amino acid adenylation domain-containing protein/non-ribosomal peptide synthase protein (TIGR01720 family)